jgi:hypothetical protein
MMDVAAGAALLVVLTLGGWWASDRSRRWEPPRWSEDAFVPLRAGARAGPAAPTLWVVTVNPRCPSCIGTLRRIHAVWARRGRPEELIALIVDSPERPEPVALRGIPPIAVWWDRENVWRGRWGHRLYGELLEFDASGRYRRSITADDAARTASREESTAPALEHRGGT